MKRNLFKEVVESLYNEEYLKSKTLIEEMYLEMTNNPKECLTKIKDYSGYTKNELVSISGLSERTIENYLYKGERNYKKQTLIRLLLSLNVPPIITRHILKISGCALNIGNTNESWLEFIISNRWQEKIDENIKLLKKVNIYL